MNEFYGLGFSGAVVGRDPDMMKQQSAAQYAMLQRGRNLYADPIAQLAQLNYRPTAFVPQGWQDWYEIGDQLQ